MPSMTFYIGILAGFTVAPILAQPVQAHQHLHPKRLNTVQQLETTQKNVIRASQTLSSTLISVAVQPAPTQKAVLPANYDFDANGIPDQCNPLTGNREECLAANGHWTTFDLNSLPIPTGNTRLELPTATTTANPSRGTLPPASVFAKQNGTRDASGKGWSLTKKGVLGYTGILGTKQLQGDKARSGSIGGRIIWNFGDMMCPDSVSVCGFDMGPAMYGDMNNILSVQTQDIATIQEASFIKPHTTNDYYTNEALGNGCKDWGMDNSNVAELNSTHGIVYSWEVWRHCPTPDGFNNGQQDRGLTASVITLGSKFPHAERISGLLAGPDSIAAGLIGTMSHDGYIYSYTTSTSPQTSGPLPITNVLVGRALASNSAIFSQASAHEFYNPQQNQWIAGIPSKSQAPLFNMKTAQSGGWTCDVYGSILYNAFLSKFMLFCDAWMSEFLFYTADRPEGPWSEMYTLLTGMKGYYGAMVHPEFTSGNGRVGGEGRLFISMGPNKQFDVWEWDFSSYAG